MFFNIYSLEAMQTIFWLTVGMMTREQMKQRKITCTVEAYLVKRALNLFIKPCVVEWRTFQGEKKVVGFTERILRKITYARK